MSVVHVPLPMKVFLWLTQKFGYPCRPLSVEIDGITYKLKPRR